MDEVGRLQGEGEWESAGTFSLDLAGRAARWPLGALARREAPWLRLVQAASRLGAGEVAFDLAGAVWSATLSTGGSGLADEWAGALGSILEMLMAQKFRQVGLELRGPDGLYSCRWPGRLTAPPRFEVREARVWAEGKREAFWREWLSLSWGATIRRELRDRLMLCGMRVTLDGRRLNTGLLESCSRLSPPLSSQDTQWTSKLQWLGEVVRLAEPEGAAWTLAAGRACSRLRWLDRTLTAEGLRDAPVVHRWLQGLPERELATVPRSSPGTEQLPLLFNPPVSRRGVPVNSVREWTVSEDAGEWIHPGGGLRMARWVGLPALPRELGRLCYIDRGVLLDPIVTNTLPAGCRCVIGDRSVRTDLSGLQVVRDRAVDEDLEWAADQCVGLWEQAHDAVLQGPVGDLLAVPPRMRDAWRAWWAYRMRAAERQQGGRG